MVILRPLSGVTRNLVSGLLSYSVCSGETSPSQTQTIFIYDNKEDNVTDLTGQTDFDAADARNLSIVWNAEQGGATDWHVYVRKGFGGSKFLGRTGNGNVKRLNCASGEPNLADEFAHGPDLNASYTFRVIRIDGHLDADDYFDMTAPVGFNLEGGNAISLAKPEPPNLATGAIAVYDDLLGGNNLAPTNAYGSDRDTSGSRAIQIAWNFGRDVSTINEYHVFVSVDGGEYQFLGQTYNGSIRYFWWTPNGEFRTKAVFAAGPQNGHSYRFRVYLLPLSGERAFLTSGILAYYEENQ